MVGCSCWVRLVFRNKGSCVGLAECFTKGLEFSSKRLIISIGKILQEISHGMSIVIKQSDKSEPKGKEIVGQKYSTKVLSKSNI